MTRLLGIVLSIGLADSLNPTTIAPALYMAAGEHARQRVTQFTLGVFVVYLLGGTAIALGPGQLLLALVPHPGHVARHIAEIAAGVAMLIAAAFLWRFRDKLGARKQREFDAQGRSSAVLGATITAVELPTAFPYFAAIAAIVGSGLDLPRQVFLLVLFNVCFILPLLGIIGALVLWGERAERILANIREYLHRHWPTILSACALVAGVIVILLGATGLGGHSQGNFGRFSRQFRHLFHLHQT
jgi:cytochrome c biogenesis protein CcdA